ALAQECHVAVAQRGQAVRAIAARVFLVADANAGFGEQAHDDREYLALRQSALRKIAPQHAAQMRQALTETDQASELARIACGAPFRVISVLLAATRIAPRGLQMSTW